MQSNKKPSQRQIGACHFSMESSEGCLKPEAGDSSMVTERKEVLHRHERPHHCERP